VRLGCKQDQGR